MILKTLHFLSHLNHWIAMQFLTNVKRYPGIRTRNHRIVCIERPPLGLKRKIHFNQSRALLSKQSHVIGQNKWDNFFQPIACLLLSKQNKERVDQLVRCHNKPQFIKVASFASQIDNEIRCCVGFALASNIYQWRHITVVYFYAGRVKANAD